MLRFFILSFAVSLGVAYLILRWQHLHARYTNDNVVRGSHKVHALCVPRIGGIAIFSGWLAGLGAAVYYQHMTLSLAAGWSFALLPVVAAGLAEDIAKRGLWKIRLGASFLAAVIACTALGAMLTRVNVWGIDHLLAMPAIAFMVTLVAIAGMTHAVNIIDGLNGLATGVCVVALLAIGYVSFSVNDMMLVLMCGLGVGALLGFRLWNYPSGRIFCGDGGAYFGGLYLAVLSVLLVSRHAQVSAWFPLLLVVYPVWETLFSAYRRRMRGLPASRADKLHMHTLFYKRVKYRLTSVDGGLNGRRNSDASVSMLILSCVGAVPAVLWWQDTAWLMTAAAAYVVLYVMLYRRLVRFGARGLRHARHVPVASAIETAPVNAVPVPARADRVEPAGRAAR